MPNNPVQIIVNSDDFRRLPDNPAGGPRKDFCPDRYPCVGASAIGTLFFRISLTHIDELIGRVDPAENIVSANKSHSTNRNTRIQL